MSLTNSLRILLLAFLAFPTLLKAQTETTISGNLLYAKIQNGLNVIVMPTPGTGNVEVTMLIRTGCSYETDSLSGMASVIHNILAEKINKRLRNNNSSISFQNTTFDDYSSTEHSVFKINTSAVNLNQCLYLLRDSVFNVKITGEEISRWISAGLKTLEEARYDKRKVFEDKVLKALFKQDHAKLEISGNPNSLKNITGSALRNFYARYYVCNNSVAVITGNFTPTVVRDQFDAIFNTLIKSEFNPENITKIVDIRPTAYTTQFVVEDTIKNPEFQICWQFPGTSANERESRYGYLLNAMLDDKNNYIHAKLTKMGCKVFRVEYEANNFSGIFRITFQPSKQNFFSTFNFIVDQVDKLDKNLLNETMMNAGKLQFRREYEELRKTKLFPEFIAKHWEYNDESYFPTLADSVMKVGENGLKDFIINTFNQSAHVVGLRISKADREALKVDSLFTDIDESVSKYVFKYRQNITDIENADDIIKRENLLQWLNVNTDINVQVNGFSDEHEYNRATNDTIIQFIDSIPTFQRSKKDIIKKGYLRPEMMRAIKIVKYLYDHGIAAERLSGTSMMYKSANKQEALENMKCTLTLDKYHKSPSLFEFHYGKKPTPAPNPNPENTTEH